MYTYQEINVTDLHPNKYNPRRTKSNMDELIASIKNVGIIEPIIVRESPHVLDQYEVVCGERRYIASLSCGLKTVPCMVRELNDQVAMQICITENLVRKSVPPIEEAEGYKKLMELSGERIEDIADKIGVSASYVARRLQLNKLHQSAIELLREEKIGIGHALEIAKYHQSVQQQILDKFYDDTDYVFYQPPTVSNIKKWIDHHVTPYLKYAPWDINDDTMEPMACISCPSNTGAQSLLFPEDQEAGRCMNRECFYNKLINNIKRSIRKLQDTMGVDTQIIFDQYFGYEDNPIFIALKDEFPGIINIDNCSAHYKPTMPLKPDYSKMNPDEIENAKEDYQQAWDDYDMQLEHYEEAIKEKSAMPCIVVTAGERNHDYEVAMPGYYTMDKHSQYTTSSQILTSKKPDSMSLEDFTRLDELRKMIKSQEEKISRGLELAFEKTAADIANQFDNEYISRKYALTHTEKTALLTILVDSMRYNNNISHIYKRKQHVDDPLSDYNQMNALTEEESNQIIRAYLLQNISNNPVNYHHYNNAKSFIELMRDIDPEFVKSKEEMYQNIYNKKAAKARERVAEYNAEIKAIKENAAKKENSGEEE